MKHNKLAYDDETVCITKGIFEIKTSIYKWDNIISIEKSETILREKANVSIIYLYNYCNHTNSSGQIKMVDNEIFDLLEEKIKK